MKPDEKKPSEALSIPKSFIDSLNLLLTETKSDSDTIEEIFDQIFKDNLVLFINNCSRSKLSHFQNFLQNLMAEEKPETEILCDRVYGILLLLANQWCWNEIDEDTKLPIDPISFEVIKDLKNVIASSSGHLFLKEHLQKFYQFNRQSVQHQVRPEGISRKIRHPLLTGEFLSEREIKHFKKNGITFPFEQDRLLNILFAPEPPELPSLFQVLHYLIISNTNDVFSESTARLTRVTRPNNFIFRRADAFIQRRYLSQHHKFFTPNRVKKTMKLGTMVFESLATCHLIHLSEDNICKPSLAFPFLFATTSFTLLLEAVTPGRLEQGNRNPFRVTLAATTFFLMTSLMHDFISASYQASLISSREAREMTNSWTEMQPQILLISGITLAISEYFRHGTIEDVFNDGFSHLLAIPGVFGQIFFAEGMRYLMDALHNCGLIDNSVVDIDAAVIEQMDEIGEEVEVEAVINNDEESSALRMRGQG